MIKYFSINDFSRYLVLLVFFVFLRASYLFYFHEAFLIELHFKGVSDKINELGTSYVEVYHHFGPFSAGVFRVFYGFFDTLIIPRLLASLLGFTQVLILTIGFNKVETYKETSLFVGIIYSVLLHLFPEMIALSPLLLALTVMCVIYVLVLNIIRGKAKEEVFLHVGFLTAVAGGFLFPMFLFSIPTLLIITIYTRFNRKSISLYLTGLVLPVLLMLAFYQFNNSAEKYLTLNFYYGFSVRFISQLGFKNYLAIALVPAVFFVFAFLKVLANRSMINARQKMIAASVFYLVSCIFILVLLPNKSVYYYLLFLPFLLHFYGLLFISYRSHKKAVWSSILFFCLLLTGSFFNAIPYVEKLVNYKPLYAHKTIESYGKVLNLSEDKNVLLNNNYATGFCEYMIAKKYFQDPSIQSTAFIYNELIEDLPDAIYDPHFLVKNKLDKLPMLKSQYNYFQDQKIYLRRK